MPAGDRLRTLRLELGLTMTEVAELSGLALSTIHRIENGDNERHTNLSVAAALAEALYVEVHDIFEPGELTHLGRPALTGAPMVAPEKEKTTRVCTECYLVMPTHRDICGVCGGDNWFLT